MRLGLIVIRQPALMSACCGIRGGVVGVGIARVRWFVMGHFQSYLLARMVDTHQQFGHHLFHLTAVRQVGAVGVSYQHTALAVVSLITRVDANATTPGYMIY